MGLEVFAMKYSFYLLCLYGLAMSYVISKVEWLKESKLFHLVHFTIFAGLSIYLWKHTWQQAEVPIMDLFYGLFKTGFVTVCNVYIFVCIVKFYVGYIPEALMGDSRVVVAQTYDKAEAAERREQWDEAIAIYQEEIARDPKNGEPYRRLAEVHIKTKDYARAARQFETALTFLRDVDRVYAVRMRLADLYADYLRDPQQAAAQLQAVVLQFPNSKHADYARTRLESFQSRGRGGP